MIGFGESKKDRKDAIQPAGPTMITQTCELFDQTYAEHSRASSRLASKLADFVNSKRDNPTKPFGKKDYGDSNTGGTYDSQVPGIKHAHLTDDISVWYTISGLSPRILRLYAILSHDESGTGMPRSSSRQRGMATRMSNQRFK